MGDLIYSFSLVSQPFTVLQKRANMCLIGVCLHSQQLINKIQLLSCYQVTFMKHFKALFYFLFSVLFIILENNLFASSFEL